MNTSSKEFKRGYLKKKSIFELGGKKSEYFEEIAVYWAFGVVLILTVSFQLH